MSTVEKQNKQSVKSTVSRWFFGIVGGAFLTRDNMFNNIPFLLFLFGIGIFYIGTSHHAEKNVIAIERLNRDLKELRSEFISTRSELMFVSKQSEVAKSVAPMGIYESVVPPKKIVIKPEERAEN